jgi:sugar phosphate isomerase/epimerase
MRSLKMVEALSLCRQIGYDCVELPVMEQWPADSASFGTEQRKEFRKSLDGSGLRLSALMENLPLLSDDTQQAAYLDRLKRGLELARELVPQQPPLVETILGSKPTEWDAVKDRAVERLRVWAEAAAEAKVMVAIKAHVGGALHRAADAAWLVRQIDSPWLKAAFDFSHFQLRGVSLAETAMALLPHSIFIHVKDGRGTAEKPEFLLPGEGTIDYVDLLRQAARQNYRGDVVVEVSGQIHSRAGYDPAAAARKCYLALAPAWEKADIERSKGNQ